MRLRMSGVSLFVMALLSACSPGSKSTDLHLGSVQPPTSSPTHSVPSTSDPTTSTSTTVVAVTNVGSTAPPTTNAMASASTSSVATTSVSVADSAPPVVALEDVPPEERVKRDFEAARHAREACTLEPYSCEYESVSVPGSPMDIETRNSVRRRIELNLRSVAGKGEVIVRFDNVVFLGDSAFATICQYDTVVIYDIADPANADDDIIYNDEKNSYRVRWELRKLEDKWLLFRGERLQELKEGDLCEF